MIKREGESVSDGDALFPFFEGDFDSGYIANSFYSRYSGYRVIYIKKIEGYEE